jgi:hypothetical protein
MRAETHEDLNTNCLLMLPDFIKTRSKIHTQTYGEDSHGEVIWCLSVTFRCESAKIVFQFRSSNVNWF